MARTAQEDYCSSSTARGSRFTDQHTPEKEAGRGEDKDAQEEEHPVRMLVLVLPHVSPTSTYSHLVLITAGPLLMYDHVCTISPPLRSGTMRPSGVCHLGMHTQYRDMKVIGWL